MNNRNAQGKEILISEKKYYSIFQRLKLDLIAAVLTLCVAAMCLGGAVLYFAILSQPFTLSPEKSMRWFQATLSMSAFFIFILSYFQAMPWFAGVLAGLIASQVPGLSLVVRIIIMVVLSMIFGSLDWLIRRNKS